jgi:Ca2+-transporting ATPase
MIRRTEAAWRVPIEAQWAQTDVSTGLDTAEARRRLERFGPNELSSPPRERWPVRLLRHLRDPMSVLLVVAAAVSGFGLGERLDGAAILAIVVLNAVIGLVQEGRAARALESLQSMETPRARVVRGGRTRVIPSPEVVPGDVMILGAGDRVPADLRLAEASSLEIDESVLTGESLPVPKDAFAEVRGDAALSDQPALAYSGTLVTRGSGRGIAVATGSQTAIGDIAEALRDRRPRTPLQQELGRLTARLGTIAVLVAAGVFGLTLLRMGLTSDSVQQSFLAAVALAVAAVPEGLATVVTVALALGVRRMAARGAIVRRLPAVETLGSTTVILTDKTGTLTENRMRLEFVALPNRGPTAPDDVDPEALAPLAQAALLCNDASGEAGDPIDRALVEALGGGRVEEIRASHPRLASIPFESERKRMTTLHREPEGVLLLVKGAPEAVVERCTRKLVAGGPETGLDDGDRSALLLSAAAMARQGTRVLALARRILPERPDRIADEERDLTLLGMVALRDPVRAEAWSAVAEARSAGIQIVMVTGDHPGTAWAVAGEVGLRAGEESVVTGARLRESGLPEDPFAVAVYARVDPEQKLALVDAGRERGEVVAVTGDGVNDAPALRRADIGVAMGKTGSDVAREAADLVVTDDNLATIVTAVREGRGIYDNIRKVVDYLVAGNLSEIIVVVAALLLFPGLGVPLFPLQLLWVNLLTDGLPAIALGVDPVDPSLMSRPPRHRGERLLGGPKLLTLSMRGLLMAAAALGSLAVARFVWGEPWEHSRAIMFTVLVAAHLLSAFVARLPSRRLTGWLVGAIFGGLTLQALIVLWPAAHPLFRTAHLGPNEWLLVVAGATVPVFGMLALERLRVAHRG